MATAHIYRADQVGSLIRPPSLLAARNDQQAGRLSKLHLERVEDRAIDEALQMQREVGIDVVTDGEYRRESFLGGLWAAVDGFAEHQLAEFSWKGESSVPPVTRSRIVSGRLRAHARIAAHEAAYLRQRAHRPFKVTLPAPSQVGMAGFREGTTDKVYPAPGAVMRELGAIVLAEVEALLADGVSYVQLDAPGYTHFADPDLVSGMRARGLDVDRVLDEAIAADNIVLAVKRPPGAVIAVHLCRGNSRGHWLADGGYDPISERLFDHLLADRLLLEYDTERAGGFLPLRHVGNDKIVVLGLLTTKSGRLEKRDDLLRRLDDASRYISLDRLAVSPQCGFASVDLGNPVSWDEQRRKLELVVDVAHTVWPGG